ncbi:hypothetical protein PT279_02675 [Bifidobacterium sp. ESL0784]|uniref:hypothetical protein n=1 Tax=Bifidobacterium sp. ESL0784 TaxID=2983231 RepID=UPI0023F62017|nr:hypothetical protein [Bifidobacterium sp. ESL0784]MDF7640496.1 hypothetical protein [Bifidobacterium sp. ESL0784]
MRQMLHDKKEFILLETKTTYEKIGESILAIRTQFRKESMQMTGNGEKDKVADVIRRHKAIVVAVGVLLAFILLITLPIPVINLKWDVIDPTYWPHQEKTVSKVENRGDPGDDGTLTAVCNDSADIRIAIYNDKGRQIRSFNSVGHLQVVVPPGATYTFVAKNTTGNWTHANVHECDTYS